MYKSAPRGCTGAGGSKARKQASEGQSDPGRPRRRGGRAAENQVLAAHGAPAGHRRRNTRLGSEGRLDPTGVIGLGGGSSLPHLGPRRLRLGGPEWALGVSWLSESLGRAGNAPGNTRPPPLPPGAGALPARPLPPGAPPSALSRLPGLLPPLIGAPSTAPPRRPGSSRPAQARRQSTGRRQPRGPPAA